MKPVWNMQKGLPRAGMASVKTFCIIGFATDISPIPPSTGISTSVRDIHNRWKKNVIVDLISGYPSSSSKYADVAYQVRPRLMHQLI
jgi:hypothetical protein